MGFTQALLMSGTRSVCLSLWNGEPARPNHPRADGEAIREQAASIAAPQAPEDALVDVTNGTTRREILPVDRPQEDMRLGPCGLI